MMNKDGNARIPLRAVQGPNAFRSEASVLDPGVSQLFQVEDQLSQLPALPAPKGQEPSPKPDNLR